MIGPPTFTTTSDPQDLVSIDSSGFVTALESGPIVSNTCVVRVLPEEYAIPDFIEAQGERTILYYPTSVNDQDIAALVNQFEIPTVNEYAYQIQSRMMGTNPFSGGRQIFEFQGYHRPA
nr:hypothetical protein [uncultured Desulfobacter sp.]